MRVFEKENKAVDVMSDVICDCCGKSCKVFIDQKHTVVNFECMTLKANWGYGSGKDMERWTAQICEKCVDEKFGFIKFKKEDLEFMQGLTIGTPEDLENKINGTNQYPATD